MIHGCCMPQISDTWCFSYRPITCLNCARPVFTADMHTDQEIALFFFVCVGGVCFRKLKCDTPQWFCGNLSSIHLGQCRIMESQQKAILRMQETCCKQGTLRMPQGQVGDGSRVCFMRVLIILIATMTEVPSRPRSAGFVFSVHRHDSTHSTELRDENRGHH